mgnify:CR=1 FL=1
MKREKLYHDKHLLLEYVHDSNYLHETWWGATPGDSFARLLDIIIQSLEEKKAKGLILDAREHKGLGPDNQKLAAEKIGAYAKKIGNFYQAIIVPEDVFSKFSVTNFTDKLGDNQNVITKFFDNLQDAEMWLWEA